MKLPAIDYSRLQPEQPDLSDPNADLRKTLGYAAKAAEGLIQVKDDMDALKTEEQGALFSTGMKQIEDYLLSGDRININDPRMPQELRDSYMKSIDPNDPDIAVQGDATYVPTNRVMGEVADYYRQKSAQSIEGIPANYQGSYTKEMARQWASFDDKLVGASRGYVREDARKSLQKSLIQYVQANDMDSAIVAAQKGRNMGLLSDAEAVSSTQAIIAEFAQRQTMQVTSASQALGAAAYAGDPVALQAGTEKLNNILKDGIEQGLYTVEQANGLAAQADREAEAMRFRGDITRIYDDGGGIVVANQVLRHAELNKPEGVSQDEWLKTISQARTDVNKRYSDESKVAKDMKETMEADNLVAQGAVFLEGAGFPVAGKDAETAMDATYDAKLKGGWASPDPKVQQKWAQNSFSIAEKTGYIPKEMKNDLVRMLGLGEANPELAALAGNLYTRMQELPNVRDDLDSLKNNVMLQEVGKNSAAGLSPAEAYQLAKEEIAVTGGMKELRNKEWALVSGNFKQSMKRANKASDDVYSEWFASDPAVGQAYMAQYRELEESMYMVLGDLDKASVYAAQQLNKTWRPSEINGTRELMQLPPEAAYGQVNGSDDWIKTDFSQFKNTQLPDLVAEYGEESIIIKSDYYTTSSKQPSYALYVRSPDSAIPIPVRTENNLRRRWYPDINQNAEYLQSVQDGVIKRQEISSSADYRDQVFNQATKQLAALESLDTGSTSPAGLQYDMQRIKNRSAAITAKAFGEIETPMKEVERIRGGGKAVVVDRAKNAIRAEAYQDAYDRKLAEIAARLEKRYQDKYPQLKPQVRAPVASRSNAKRKAYIPKI